ncbi:SDR family oxidoreductase [Zhouia sp. PK063]|uniref:SDR family oxidoreductase n=1 Tax=Zhouia sp. PK063 TaxID=3373602 RepID=UPI0037901654
MERVLIVGATGGTGNKLVNILKATNSFEPVAMIRKKEQQATFDEIGVKTFLADLEGDLSKAVKNIDKIIFAAGSGSETGPEKTIAIDQEGAKKLIDEAKKAKVKKFVMLSAINADDPQSNKKLEHYLKAKKNADEHLQKSGLKYTIVRPGTLSDEIPSGTIDIAEKLDYKNDITRQDVAHVLALSLADNLVQNKTFEVLEGSMPVLKALQSFS